MDVVDLDGRSPESDIHTRALSFVRPPTVDLLGVPSKLDQACALLRPRERQIVELLSAGQSGKAIAIELGVSEATVSSDLRSVARKLGARSRLDLIRRLASGPSTLSGLEAMTPAEREVTRQVLDGLTNVEIARGRGTSPRTIDNQIASVFRKLNVASRVELATKVWGTLSDATRSRPDVRP